MISSAGFSCPALFVVKLLVFATVPVVMFADLFFFFFADLLYDIFDKPEVSAYGKVVSGENCFNYLFAFFLVEVKRRS